MIGGVNLYAGAPDAFTPERCSEVTALFDAAVPEGVINADLSMSSYSLARQAPAELRDRATVDQAIGVLVAQRGISGSAARSLILGAARRAGVTDPQAAAVVLRLRDVR